MTRAIIRSPSSWLLLLCLFSPAPGEATPLAGQRSAEVRTSDEDNTRVVAAKGKAAKGKKKRKGKAAVEEPTAPAAATPTAEPTPAAAAEPTAQPASESPAPPPPPAPETGTLGTASPTTPGVAAPTAIVPTTPGEASTPAAAPAAAGGAAPVPALETINAAPLGGGPAVDATAAQEQPAAPGEVFPVTVGVELGVGFPQLLSPLRTTFVPTLEVGYLLPMLSQRLQVQVGISYVSPDYSTYEQDPRFTESGNFRFRIKEEELSTTLGALFRVFPPKTFLNFYGQAGLQVRWQRSTVRGNANGEPLGVNRETRAEVGGMLAAGAELRLGPGALAADLAMELSDLDHRVTGDSTAGGLGLQVGYHFLF